MPEETSAELLARYREGDQHAADELFCRYVARLTILARSRLTSKLASRTDPEDVVLSAYRSFFVGAREGRFTLTRSGDLWRLLVSITMHKLHRQVRKHSAARRSVISEESLLFTSENQLPFSRDPSPEEALEIADQLAFVLSALDPFARRVLELRLQEEPLSAISAETGRSKRTIRRTLREIKQRLVEQLQRDHDA